MKDKKSNYKVIIILIFTLIALFGVKVLAWFIDTEYHTVTLGNKTLKFVVNDGVPNFSVASVTDEGVYAMEDDDGVSYYYRGAVENNYVKFGRYPEELYRGYHDYYHSKSYKEFNSLDECSDSYGIEYCKKSPNAGKDMYWRIIRINGNKTIRVIYDGTMAHENGESNIDRLLLYNESYNLNKEDAKFVGYMYGGSLDSKSESKIEAQTNDTESNAKLILDKWYEQVFLNTEFEKYISDEVFCNDRSTAKKAYTWMEEDSALGYGERKTYFGSMNRIENNLSPTFKCNTNDSIDVNNDKFTVSDSKGNGKLKYPIGLITADEIMAAGGVPKIENKSYYLYKGKNYFSMSPYSWFTCSGASLFNVTSDGEIKNNSVIYGSNFAPVINLNTDFIFGLKGSGTMDDPYRIE